MASVGAAMASDGARKTLSIIHFLSEDVVSLAESPLSIVASPVLSTVEFSLNFCSEQRWIQPSQLFYNSLTLLLAFKLCCYVANVFKLLAGSPYLKI